MKLKLELDLPKTGEWNKGATHSYHQDYLRLRELVRILRDAAVSVEEEVLGLTYVDADATKTAQSFFLADLGGEIVGEVVITPNP